MKFEMNKERKKRKRKNDGMKKRILEVNNNGRQESKTKKA